MYFSFFQSRFHGVEFFVLLMQLLFVLFFIVAPFSINSLLSLEKTAKKVNSVVMIIGFCLTLFYGAVTIFHPDLIFTFVYSSTTIPYISWHPVLSFVFLLRNVLLMLYLLYLVVQLLVNAIYHKYNHSLRSIIIGMAILCYFVITYLYNLYFYKNYFFPYPHFELGLVLFTLSISFSTINTSIESIKHLKVVQHDFDRLLYYDGLLNIPNRMALMNDIQSHLQNMRKKGERLSLIAVDIDDFQNYNDCFGEDRGNELLKNFSSRLTDYFADIGNVYRLDGDSFALLMHADRVNETAEHYAEKIIASLRNSFLIAGESYTLTASLGILSLPEDGENPETILNNIRTAVMAAKKSKNTYVVFSDELAEKLSNKVHTVGLLRRAINHDQFTLFYQPIVDQNGKLEHVEALLRNTTPGSPVGGPEHFIPLLEEAGLMKEVDNMVLSKALHDMEMHIKDRCGISINLSADQISNPAYADFLTSFVDQHGIDHQQIVLEVTESMLIENIGAGRETLLKLKRKGFRIAIDDFGKGFSSLAYLAEFPVDILKMDLVFVHAVPGNSRDEAIAQHIIQLAHSLDLKVTAEGFEEEKQVDFIRNLGGDLYQGYYFSKPLPLDELLKKYPG